MGGAVDNPSYDSRLYSDHVTNCQTGNYFKHWKLVVVTQLLERRIFSVRFQGRKKVMILTKKCICTVYTKSPSLDSKLKSFKSCFLF